MVLMISAAADKQKYQYKTRELEDYFDKIRYF